MKKLEKFKKFSLSALECKQIKGGEYAYCTNGADGGSCFQYLNDAVSSCLHSLGCNSVTVQQV